MPKEQSLYRKRVNYARIPSVIDVPDLIETQQKSYQTFLQMDALPEQRGGSGLQEVFESVFPIKGRDGSLLEFCGYSFGRPKYDVYECVDRGMTYAVPLRIKVRLVVKEAGSEEENPEIIDVREEDIYLGELPLMTPKGTFIINGAERVVVSQLHRSPGPFFSSETHPSGRQIVAASIIPNRGAWLEFETDANGVISVIIDRKRKIPVTTLLRAFGFSTDEEILSLFCDTDIVKVNSKTAKKNLVGKSLALDVIHPETGEVLYEAGTIVDDELFDKLVQGTTSEVRVVTADQLAFEYLCSTVAKDTAHSMEEALVEIYQLLRPGEPPALKNAQNLVENLFFRSRRYDLSKVGRYRMNKKLSLDIPLEEVTLTPEDLVGVVRYILNLADEKGYSDDIDHLGNRRVRTIGELMENQFRVGLARMERSIREKMGILDLENVMPRNLINAKPITSAINEFFGRSQLSQFLDQINPLAELTHKRRLSALGPGGLNRERAGFEVRDVHHTHYGRICPIETPEGPNIGLISSLSTYARINDFGFIETPYRKVAHNGSTMVSKDIVYLSADDEDQSVIAQANAPLNEEGNFMRDHALCRHRGEFPMAPIDEVNYMDVSPKQLVSVSASLIPFLEHDDANRALMGSNMQRQAVPLLKTQAPYVGTGMEYKAAKDSGVVVVARRAGTVEYVSADKILIRPKDAVKDSAVGHDEYFLQKFIRSNQNTCINQKPIVRVGDKVKAGQTIADGPATELGELALGRNVMTAFMSWEGYNFEDAIIVSERLLKEDAYTSVHVEEFKIEARDTKLGEEEITRDIPNVGEEALKNLDENGIIRVGANVKPGDILVGKISPKGKAQTSNVEKLLRAIFGKRAEDVRDISLKAPPGTNGVVIDVKVFARKIRGSKTRSEDERAIKRLTNEKDKKLAQLAGEMDRLVRELLPGKTLRQDVIDPETGEVVLPRGTELTPTALKKVANLPVRDIQVKDSAIIDRIIHDYEAQIEDAIQNYEKQVEYIKTGDNLPPGVIKLVKVYVAKKKRLAVGDKMAGRHGNKGVVAKIVPEEDMPFLSDGTPIDIVLNPLGVPSRMNVGQVMEIHMGWAAKTLGRYLSTPVFDGATDEQIVEMLEEAGLPSHGKATLHDGRTGEPFDQEVAVGYMYMMKLNHLVDDKIHARSIGPYSLVTQQPLGGKAQFGGQRLGEMEVWALEAYGAAYTLQELLTVKSDDIVGRNKIYEAIVKGENAKSPGLPESFYVLVKELQSLGLGIELHEEDEEEPEEIAIMP
jgi:DNA-directed RNA polymerase subunit beta